MGEVLPLRLLSACEGKMSERAILLFLFLRGCIMLCFSERNLSKMQPGAACVPREPWLGSRAALCLGHPVPGHAGSSEPSHRHSSRNPLPTREQNGTAFICTSITSKGPLSESVCL